MALEVGMPAPDFTLPLAYGGTVSLSNMRGKPVILYFYPKDDTPGCTTQACSFRDMLPEFGHHDAAVIGISKDSVSSHLAFAKKYGLYFHLASDENGHVSEDYGVWVKKNNYGKVYDGIERTTFLINEKGTIRAIWRRVSVEGHAKEVLQAVEALRLNLPYSFPGAKPPPPEPKPEPVKPQEKESKKMPAKKTTMIDAIATPAIKAASSVVKTVTKVIGGKPAKKAAKKTTAKKAVKKAVAKSKTAVKKTVKAVAKKAAPAAKKAAKAKTAVKKAVKKVVKKAAPKKAAKKTTAKKTKR